MLNDPLSYSRVSPNKGVNQFDSLLASDLRWAPPVSISQAARRNLHAMGFTPSLLCRMKEIMEDLRYDLCERKIMGFQKYPIRWNRETGEALVQHFFDVYSLMSCCNVLCASFLDLAVKCGLFEEINDAASLQGKPPIAPIRCWGKTRPFFVRPLFSHQWILLEQEGSRPVVIDPSLRRVCVAGYEMERRVEDEKNIVLHTSALFHVPRMSLQNPPRMRAFVLGTSRDWNVIFSVCFFTEGKRLAPCIKINDSAGNAPLLMFLDESDNMISMTESGKFRVSDDNLREAKDLLELLGGIKVEEKKFRYKTDFQIVSVP